LVLHLPDTIVRDLQPELEAELLAYPPTPLEREPSPTTESSGDCPSEPLSPKAFFMGKINGPMSRQEREPTFEQSLESDPQVTPRVASPVQKAQKSVTEHTVSGGLVHSSQQKIQVVPSSNLSAAMPSHSCSSTEPEPLREVEMIEGGPPPQIAALQPDASLEVEEGIPPESNTHLGEPQSGQEPQPEPEEKSLSAF
jgi:hypothetical protein